MIDFYVKIRTSWGVGWNGINVERVKAYKKELERYLENIRKVSLHKILKSHPDIENEVKKALTEEISYCNFYLEFEKAKKRKSFNKWVSMKPENRPDLYSHMYSHHDTAMVKRNGRRMAIIEVNTKKGIMKHVSLRIRNDSDFLEFAHERYSEESVKYLTSDKSIDNFVAKLKEKADTILAEPFPKYLLTEHKILLQLLQVEEENL